MTHPVGSGLVITGLGKQLGGRLILDGLELVLRPGEFVAVMGESGAGKSTLLNLIAGLDSADTGAIRIDGSDLAGLDDDGRTLLRRARVGFVFQAFHLLPHLSLLENVALPLVLLGVAPGEREVRARGLLAAVGLGVRADDLPRELSGGEMQRVAVARALVHRPALVLADEPTGNLDPESAGTVLDLLGAQVRDAGAAGLLVTHSAAAAAHADRVLVLEHGRLRSPR